MRFVLHFLTAVFFLHTVAAQNGSTVVQGGILVSNPGNKPVYLRDVFSTPLQPKSYPGFDGSPFLYDNWLLAKLKFADDRVVDSIYIKLNAYENKVHFKDENGEEMQVSVKINEITITDNNPKWHNLVFRSGYEGDINAFFQVLTDGRKLQLLKKIMVIKWESTAIGEEGKKTFQLDQELFFSANEILFRQNKKCSSLTDVFKANKEDILRFVSANNIRCDKEDDMKKLADYFNSL